MAAPNQKTVSINKEKCDKNHLYTCVNIDALTYAMKDMTPAQFKVWFYFAKNQNKYTFELSSVAVQEFCNISDKTYRDAVKTLIEKRYLIKRSDSKIYDFYEIPPRGEMIADGTIIECHTTTIFTFE